MKRKILSMVLTLCMLMAFVPCARAAEVVDSGQCGDNLTWTLDADGTVTIDGEGDMWNYGWETYIFSPFDSNLDVKKVVIGDNVTSIGSCAFINCTELDNVTIGSNIKSINDSAFSGCSQLDNIILPDNVISISDWAFFDTGLSSHIEIPRNVTEIASTAFSQCDNLKNIYVIGQNSTFSSKDGVLFNKEGTSLITYPCGKTEKNYIIHDGTMQICDYAFSDNEYLSTIKMPECMLKIGEEAFGRCNKLKQVDINDGIEEFGNFAFYFCSSLTNIYIPGSIKIFGSHTFHNCESLSEVTLGSGITEIGGYAFTGCKNLKNITIPDTVTSIRGWAFGDSGLTNIVIPNGVTDIDVVTFASTDLEYIVLPKFLKRIDWQAFWNCSSLKSIVIPASVEYIGNGAFNHCDALTDVYYAGSEESWNQISFDYSNKALNDANIHYNAVGMMSPRITNTDVFSENKVKIDLDDVEYTSNMIAVFADTNGLVAAETVELIAGDTEKSVEIPSGATQAKIFIWDSLTGMHPLCEAKELNLK